MDIDEINKDLKSIQTLVNSRPIDEFDGRSPTEMFYLLHKTFDKDSPFQFRKHIDENVLEQIPFLKLTDYYLRLIHEQEPVKLTTRGNLPVKLVKEIYEQKIIPEELFEIGIYKLYKEQDSSTVHTTRIISHLARLTKKQNNKMTLTNKAKKILDRNAKYELFKELFKVYTTKFNWAYNDGYGDNPIGQLGFAFTLEQLIKHGNIERQDTFYGEKYLNAFPTLLEYTRPLSFRTEEEELISCFSLRTFNGFLDFFGLIEIREEGKDILNKKTYIRKTKILDELIMFE